MHERGTELSNVTVYISGAPSLGSANRHLAWTRAAWTGEGIYVTGSRLLVFPQTKPKLRSYFVTRIKDVFLIYRLLINPSKPWHS
jgi:hypothetical protein